MGSISVDASCRTRTESFSTEKEWETDDVQVIKRDRISVPMFTLDHCKTVV